MIVAPPPAGLDPKQAHVAAEWAAGRPLVCCRFEPKGRYVFCGVEGPDVQRFDLADGKKTAFAGGHESWVFSLAFSADGATTFSGGGDGVLAAWETAAAGAKPIRRVEAHRGWIRATCVSPDGALVATGGNDRLVKLWEASTGKPVREFQGHAAHVYSLEFHPDGKTLLSGDLLGVVKQWDVATGSLAGTFDAKPLHHYDGGQQVDFGGVRSLAITPDGKLVAAGGLHKATNPLGAVHEPIVLLFDGAGRKVVQTCLADGIPQGVVWRLRFLADGSLVAASGGGSGGLLLFWKTDAAKDYHRLALPNIVREMDLHPDGLRLATAHHDGKLRITRLAAKSA